MKKQLSKNFNKAGDHLKLYKTAVKFAVVIAIIAVWELLSKLNVLNKLLFPSFSDILISLVKEIKSGDIMLQTYNSLKLIILGIALSIAISVILMLINLIFPNLSNIYDTIISIVDPLPGVALLPLAILWFGVGDAAIIFIIVHSVLWPMLLNIMTGLKTIPKTFREVGSNIGLSGVSLFIKVLLPASTSHILTGLKVGWSRAWRALISAEMIFGAASQGGGLGWYIYEKRYMLDIPGLYAGLFIIIIIGILIEDILFGYIEKNTVKKWGMI